MVSYHIYEVLRWFKVYFLWDKNFDRDVKVKLTYIALNSLKEKVVTLSSKNGLPSYFLIRVSAFLKG